MNTSNDLATGHVTAEGCRKRKVPVRPLKINKRFHLGAQTFLSFGFGDDLDVEVRLCRKSDNDIETADSIRFDIATWEALVAKLGPLSGWTSCTDATSYDAILTDTPNLIVSAHASQNSLKFEILVLGGRSQQFILNTVEASELNRLTGFVTNHITSLVSNIRAFALMVDVIWFNLRSVYSIVLPGCEYELGFNDIDDHLNFDVVIGYFTSYVSPFKIISDFETQLDLQTLTCDFQSYNVFSMIMGQTAHLKRRFHK